MESLLTLSDVVVKTNDTKNQEGPCVSLSFKDAKKNKIALSKLQQSKLIDSILNQSEIYEKDEWDKQIEEDNIAGRLDDLFAEAKAELKAGRCKKL